MDDYKSKFSQENRSKMLLRRALNNLYEACNASVVIQTGKGGSTVRKAMASAENALRKTQNASTGAVQKLGMAVDLEERLSDEPEFGGEIERYEVDLEEDIDVVLDVEGAMADTSWLITGAPAPRRAVVVRDDQEAGAEAPTTEVEEDDGPEREEDTGADGSIS